jgi:hypothetical protein
MNLFPYFPSLLFLLESVIAKLAIVRFVWPLLPIVHDDNKSCTIAKLPFNYFFLSSIVQQG